MKPVVDPKRWLIATYGTLRTGQSNHIRLCNPGAELICEGTITGYRMVDLGRFPGIVPDERETVPIACELYVVNDAVLASLDRLEGHPRFYERVPVTFTDMMGGRHNAQTYVYRRGLNGDEPVIEFGDWVQYTHLRSSMDREAAARRAVHA